MSIEVFTPVCHAKIVDKRYFSKTPKFARLFTHLASFSLYSCDTLLETYYLNDSIDANHFKINHNSTYNQRQQQTIPKLRKLTHKVWQQATNPDKEVWLHCDGPADPKTRANLSHFLCYNSI